MLASQVYRICTEEEYKKVHWNVGVSKLSLSYRYQLAAEEDLRT